MDMDMDMDMDKVIGCPFTAHTYTTTLFTPNNNDNEKTGAPNNNNEFTLLKTKHTPIIMCSNQATKRKSHDDFDCLQFIHINLDEPI